MDIAAIFRSKCHQAGTTAKGGQRCRALWHKAIVGIEAQKNPHMVTIQVQKLIDFVAEVFAHAESSTEEARRIATYLTTANLTGHDSHGVIRVPVYIRWKKMRSVVPDQTIEVVVDTPSLAVIDGKFGYGQTVTPQAVQIGIDKCRKAGLAAVALRNAGHVGRVGDWAEMAAAEGLVSIHFVNAAGSLLVAPYGGVEKRLSTAPYCVGIPRQGQDPIVLDFATSIVAEGKVLVASRGGKKLPQGALIDSDGTLSEDPAVLYGPYQADGPRDHTKGSGAIRAVGEHKGSGLAFICELLGGALTGTGATSADRRFANGMFSVYVDPQVVDTTNYFDGEVSRYVDFIRATKPVAGVNSVLIPGDPERKMRAERSRNGVPLPDDTWAAIVATARDVGVSEVSIQRATM
jgi:hydroxycarboxylate dehydrogenase B